MRSMLIAIGLAAAAVALSAALAQPDRGPDRSQDLAWMSAQQSYFATLKPEDGWRYATGGLYWRRVAGDGVGPRPSLDDEVTVHYAGTFIDGEEFDSSYSGGKPITFPLGRLIPAWQQAIPMMAVGDTFEIVAPADLAYGPLGKGPIPGGATLVFTVELLGIE